MSLRQVEIKTNIRGATAKTQVELYYHNPSRDTTLRNSVFRFPLDGGKFAAMMTKFEAIIDDTVVHSEVKSFQNKVEDEDNFLNVSEVGADLRRSSKPSFIEFKLGELEPGQPVTIKFQMIILL